MSDMRREMEEGLKPGTVKYLLEKCAILRSIIEEATNGNVASNPSLRYAYVTSPMFSSSELLRCPQSVDEGRRALLEGHPEAREGVPEAQRDRQLDGRAA